MPVAGSGSGLRQERFALRRRKARGGPERSGSFDLDGRDGALHPVHPLRAFRPGSRRRHGIRHAGPRRALRNHDVRRQDRRLGSLGQHDRPVPGRRAHQQAIPLFGTSMGTAAPQVGLAARFAGREPDRSGQGWPCHARTAARERSGQRMLAVGQRAFLVRSAEQHRPPDETNDQAGRHVAGSRVADRPRIR
jgi:hypothetical protein